MLNITYLVASTTLLMLFWPILSSAVRSQSGDGPTRTPLMYAAVNRGQSCGFSIVTFRALVFGSRETSVMPYGCGTSGRFKIADNSFAIPRYERQSCPRLGVTL